MERVPSCSLIGLKKILILTYLNDFGHFLDVYDAVAVDVVHSKRPFEFFFGCAAGRDVYCEQKFLKRNWY